MNECMTYFYKGFYATIGVAVAIIGLIALAIVIAVVVETIRISMKKER